MVCLVGRAPRLPTPACGDLAPRPGATAAKLPPSQRRPAPLAERLERGLFKLRRDLDLAHLGGGAARPPLERAEPHLSPVAVSGPVRLVPHPMSLLAALLSLCRASSLWVQLEGIER